MKLISIALIAALLTSQSWAGNDEEVGKHIEKAKQLIKTDDFAKAKESLMPDFQKYVVAFFEKKADLKDPVGYPRLQTLAMYSALVEFVLGEYPEGYNCVNGAVGLRNIGWGRSWDEHFAAFKNETESMFIGKSKPMKARMYYTISAINGVIEDDEDEMVYLKRAYASDPNDFEVTIALARATKRSGNIAGSKEYFLKAVELDPKNAKAASDAAMVLNATGESPKALGLIQKAVRLDPEDQKARINEILFLYVNGRSAESEKACVEAMRKFPEKRDFLERASLYSLLDQKKYAEAAAIAKKFSASELAQNQVFTALAAVAFAFGGDLTKGRLIAGRLATEYPICKDEKFLNNNWSFRRGILTQFKDLIGR